MTRRLVTPRSAGEPPQATANRERMARVRAAWQEVANRGHDPKNPRAYRGRVTLTLRCEPERHLLGKVHPTEFGPLLVPARPRVRQSDAESRAVERRFREQFGQFLDARPSRDSWEAHTQVGDERLTTEEVQGFAVTLLLPRETLSADELRDLGMDGEQAEAGMVWVRDLYCRCGQRVTEWDSLVEAVERGGTFLI